ncbi:GNAT family N-acetyltransferase [Agrobacterium vitis]|uniref:N-acetyltransferase n=1 Tax=Agrobacterium vitis TaxID=373 RepID=A0AAE2RGQ4_AGRVI|nr:GNAT family N-acetyltransferase [Agrobacterium vitis]MBF2717936.1 N-acetyltransferase [Agrobacterium vitis]MUZ61830.1 GNAT family N-acetyltransferase [Agrobacterium vitis]MVA21813.1 GNAT family N-acetyltransferase [Agrobacterium vitis]
MPVQIRAAIPADIPSITEIYRHAILTGKASYEITPPDEAEMAQRMEMIASQSYPYIVAEDGDGGLLGYAYASAFRTRPAYRWLVEDSIYLAEAAQGKGIGKALLADLVAQCTALGFRQMIAVIGGANPASIGVHRSLDFTHAGGINGSGFKHGTWLDTVFMQRALGEGNQTLPDEKSYPGSLFKG